MKKMAISAAVIAAVLLTGCKKESNEAETTSNSNNSGSNNNSTSLVDSLSGTFNNKFIDFKYNVKGDKAFKTVVVFGNTEQEATKGDQLYIDLPLNPTKGTHDLDENGDYGIRFFKGDLSGQYIAKKGSAKLVIDQVELNSIGGLKNSKGSFSGWLYNSFTGKSDSVEVKNGYFSIK